MKFVYFFFMYKFSRIKNTEYFKMHMVKHSEYILKLFISVYLNQMFLFEFFPFLLTINR